MNPIPSKCPVCGGELIVTRLHCPSCETSIEGSFAPGGTPLQEAFTPEQLRSLLPFARLSQEQLYFMLTFMRCEGRFNRMEEELKLSYPTLRSRFDDIIRALGFEPGREDARDDPLRRDDSLRRDEAALRQDAHQVSADERQVILDMLSRGEIDVEGARRRLRGEPPEPNQPTVTTPSTEPTEPIQPTQPDQPEE